MEDNASGSGMYVTFERYMQMRDGRVEKVRDNLLFSGSLKQFKGMHPNFAIIGYHPMNEGEVSPNAVMLNEVLPPLPSTVNNAPMAVITPELLQKAADAAMNPVVAAPHAPQLAAPAPNKPQNVPPEEKIIKDGDSYLKMAGGKIFKLTWSDYDDEAAPFDKKIRSSADGKLQLTTWVELV